MNSETSSSTNASPESAAKVFSDVADLHENSLLEVMNSTDGGDNIEFEPPIANIILKPAVFD